MLVSRLALACAVALAAGKAAPRAPRRFASAAAVRSAWHHDGTFVGAGGRQHHDPRRYGGLAGPVDAVSGVPPLIASAEDVAGAPRISAPEVCNSRGTGFSFRGCVPPVASSRGASNVACLLPASASQLQVTTSEKARPGDWVGLFSPPDSASDEFVDWYEVNATTHPNEQNFTFYPLNMRTEYELRYFRRENSHNYTCLRSSGLVSFRHLLLEPTQAHLSFAGRRPDDTAVVLTWVSGTSHIEHAPVVNFWWSGAVGRYAYQDGPSGRYLASDMCGSPANVSSPSTYRDVGYIHSVVLDGLPFDTIVHYAYGQASVLNVNNSFKTAPDPSASRDLHWNFIGYGDQGVSGAVADGESEIGPHAPGSYFVNSNLRRMVLGWESEGAKQDPGAPPAGSLGDTRFVLHFGDLSYARSVGFIWELWQTEVAPVATRVPYMVSVGNHEYDHVTGGEKDPSNAPGTGFHPSWGNYEDDSSGECGVPVHWRFPHPPPSGHGVFWYSFSYANMHIVQLSSEHDYTVGSAQYTWLDADLRGVDRTRFPWLVVTSHRPAYQSQDYSGDFHVAENMAHHLDPLLLKHRVNLFLAGHYHSYERTCSVTGGLCDERKLAPVHICVGAAGAWLDDAGYLGEWWSMSRHQTFGFANVKVNGAKNLTVDFWGLSKASKRAVERGEHSASPAFEVLDSVVVLGEDRGAAGKEAPAFV